MYQEPNTARWPEFLKDKEKQRVKVIDERLGRVAARKGELIKEKKTLRRRAIARLRRSEGKT